MSCGCGTDHNNGKAVVDRVRQKGFENRLLPEQFNIKCSCGEEFIMKTLVDKCPKCNLVYGVTPCSADNVENVRAAEINY